MVMLLFTVLEKTVMKKTKKIRRHAPRDLTNQNVLFVEQKRKQPRNVLIFRAWKELFSEVCMVKFSLYSKLV